jgi:hypothetical protein
VVSASVVIFEAEEEKETLTRSRLGRRMTIGNQFGSSDQVFEEDIVANFASK